MRESQIHQISGTACQKTGKHKRLFPFPLWRTPVHLAYWIPRFYLSFWTHDFNLPKELFFFPFLIKIFLLLLLVWLASLSIRHLHFQMDPLSVWKTDTESAAQWIKHFDRQAKSVPEYTDGQSSITLQLPEHLCLSFHIRNMTRPNLGYMEYDEEQFLHTFYSSRFCPMPWVNKTHITRTLCHISVVILGACSAKAAYRPCSHHT